MSCGRIVSKGAEGGNIDVCQFIEHFRKAVLQAVKRAIQQEHGAGEYAERKKTALSIAR